MGVLPPTKTTQYLLACLSLWCTGALLAVCHDATDPAVDSGVIAKRGAAPHSGIRIKRAPSWEPVRLPVLPGSLRLVAKDSRRGTTGSRRVCGVDGAGAQEAELRPMQPRSSIVSPSKVR